MTTKTITTYGIGIALYVALSLALQVPFFENYYLCLGYVVLAVYCYSFGMLGGILVGTMGCVLYCLLINGLRGMPGWTLGNLFLSIALSFTFARTKKMKNPVAAQAINVFVIVLATAIAMLVVKSLTEHLLYAQPFLVRSAKNFYAFIADTVTLLAALPICVFLDKYLKKQGKTSDVTI